MKKIHECNCGNIPEIRKVIGIITKDTFLEMFCNKCGKKSPMQWGITQEDVVIDEWNQQFKVKKKR